MYLGIIFNILSKIFPTKENFENATAEEIVELDKYTRYYNAIMVPYLILFFSFITLFSLILGKGLGNYQAELLKGSDSIYAYGVNNDWFYLFTFIISILIAWIFTELIIKSGCKLIWRVPKQKVAQRLRYMEYKHTKANSLPNFKPIGLVLLPILIFLSIGLIYFGLNAHLIIKDDKIIYRGFIDIKETIFTYDEIAKILYIESFRNMRSNEIERDDEPYYVLILNNGFVINLNQYGQDDQTTKDGVNYISKKSGVPIIEGVHNIDDVNDKTE